MAGKRLSAPQWPPFFFFVTVLSKSAAPEGGFGRKESSCFVLATHAAGWNLTMRPAPGSLRGLIVGERF